MGGWMYHIAWWQIYTSNTVCLKSVVELISMEEQMPGVRVVELGPEEDYAWDPGGQQYRRYYLLIERRCCQQLVQADQRYVYLPEVVR